MMKELYCDDRKPFVVTVEVVPTAGPDPGVVLAALEGMKTLGVDGFSVATNPVAKPAMSALVLCSLIQERTGRPAVLHCTPRDHNRLSLQGELWGAAAVGIGTVMAATGDQVAAAEKGITTSVDDVDVFGLIRMASDSGLCTGAVFDWRPEVNGLAAEAERLKRKADAGARFVVTQPVYDPKTAEILERAVRPAGIPVIMGILPLRTPKHAEFLHNRVAGIAVPDRLRQAMQAASDPVARGVENSREMLTLARQMFRGACVMPPFNHYEVMPDILS